MEKENKGGNMIRRIACFRMSDDEFIERLGLREYEEIDGEVGIFIDIDLQDGTHCWVLSAEVKVTPGK